MKRSIITMLCMALITVGCSATGEKKPRKPSLEEMLAQVTEQDGRSCVRVDDIDGYAPLDDTMVSVSARGRKHYLMTTMFRCNSLRGTFRVGVSGRFSEVCGGGMGNLVTDEETCPIRNIYEFPSRDDAFAALSAAEARREAQELFPDEE